jgi:hypothetical protein
MSPTKTKEPKAPERRFTPAAAGGAPPPTYAPADVGTLPATREDQAAPALHPPDAAQTGVEAQAVSADGVTAWQTATVGGLYTTNHTANAWAYLNAIGWRRISPANASAHQLMLELCRLSRDAGVPLQVDEDGSTIKTIYLW